MRAFEFIGLAAIIVFLFPQPAVAQLKVPTVRGLVHHFRTPPAELISAGCPAPERVTFDSIGREHSSYLLLRRWAYINLPENCQSDSQALWAWGKTFSLSYRPIFDDAFAASVSVEEKRAGPEWAAEVSQESESRKDRARVYEQVQREKEEATARAKACKLEIDAQIEKIAPTVAFGIPIHRIHPNDLTFHLTLTQAIRAMASAEQSNARYYIRTLKADDPRMPCFRQKELAWGQFQDTLKQRELGVQARIQGR